jgi:Fe-S oxidoreductase
MGSIGDWAPIASRFPQLTNFMTSTRPLARISKWGAGVAPERHLQFFAKMSFRRLARPGLPAASLSNGANPKKVILRVETFADHFSPHIASAASDVLARLGYQFLLPGRRLCCGRLLYDFGYLDRARLLRTAINELARGHWKRSADSRFGARLSFGFQR